MATKNVAQENVKYSILFSIGSSVAAVVTANTPVHHEDITHKNLPGGRCYKQRKQKCCDE